MEENITRELYQIQDLEIVVDNELITSKGYTLLDFDMNFKENNHTQLSLKLKSKRDYINEWYFTKKESLDKDLNGNVITIMLQGRKVFTGIIQKLVLQESGSDEYEIFVLSKSKSELLDRNKIYRVFQNPNISYYDLITEVLERYKNLVNFIMLKENLENKYIQNGLIVQYEETDWEFLVRIVSHLGLAIFNTENGGVTIGLSPNTSNIKSWINEKSSLHKIFDKNENYYEGNSLCFYTCGDRIENSSRYTIGYITEGKIISKEGYFQGKYTIKTNENMFLYIPHEKIKGIVIEGEVKRVPLNNFNNIAIMTVDFTKGLEKIVRYKLKDNLWYKPLKGRDYSNLKKEKIQRFNFPYTTPYSKTKSGLFCTPEIGDTISVIFPTSEEGEAYVLGAVNNKESLRFSNPFIRSYNTTEKEQEVNIKLNKDLNENINNITSMEDFLDKTEEQLYNFELNEKNLNIYVKDNIIETTTNKSENNTKLKITTEKDITLISNTYKIEVSDKISEKTKEKKEEYSKRIVNLTTKQETANNIQIIANTHTVSLG